MRRTYSHVGGKIAASVNQCEIKKYKFKDSHLDDEVHRTVSIINF